MSASIEQLENRINDLEIKFCHQDASIEQMSDEMFSQQKRIAELEKLCEALLKSLKEVLAQSGTKVLDEKPPHY